MIVGEPAAGKTTLASKLGKLLDLPVYHLDNIFWLPGGPARPWAEVQSALEQVFASEGYILEGSYEQTYAARLADCDTLIWLDMGVTLRFFRHLRRMCWRPKARSNRALSGHAGPTSSRVKPVLAQIVEDHPKMVAELARLWSARPAHVRAMRFDRPRQVRAFLATIPTGEEMTRPSARKSGQRGLRPVR